MASPGRQSTARLIERLLARPEAFELFEAIRIVEEDAARAARERSDRPPPRIGSQDSESGRRDPVRFRATLSEGFPGGAITGSRLIAQADGNDDAPAVELDIASFGLVGPSGVLPRHYTALINDRRRRFKDDALRDFLDIFGHRAVSLLARAWAKYRLAVQHGLRKSADRTGEAATAGTADPFVRVLESLLGLGTPPLGARRPPGENVYFHHAGTLSRRIAAVLPLEQLIAHTWQVGAQIEQFVGRWLALDPAEQTRLGNAATAVRGRGVNRRLGVDAIAGSRVWSVESAFRVRLGPLPWGQFRRWLPDGERLGGLALLVRYHVGPQFDILICPVLRADDVPSCSLGGAAGGRLGWTTWLVSRPPQQDVDDAEFTVQP